MIQIKNLTVKNFMSVVNATQGVDFDRKDPTSKIYDPKLLLQISQAL